MTEQLRIFITGASGFVGGALLQTLRRDGHHITRLVRSAEAARETDAMLWKPDEEAIDPAPLDGADIVIHLAGENIAGRWTERKKRAIHNSRSRGTLALSEALAKLAAKPQAFVCASAIGYYGSRGDETLDESSSLGPSDQFLPEVCAAWEAACDPAREAGIRVVNLRFGLILSQEGGALAQMLTPFKLGVAGVLGSGDQWWSWIALDDVIRIIQHAMTDDRYADAINVVAPNPVTNREFTKTLGKVLRRPTVLPMPAVAARLAFGREMADETLLASTKVMPRRLQELDFDFAEPELEPALRRMLASAR